MVRSRNRTENSASSKRRIEQYDHKRQQRKNNPPVGLVTEATDRDAPKRRYDYDPHLDPTLTWVFFPMADEGGGWARLARNLKAEIDLERIEAYRGSVWLPFEPGVHRRVGVKIVDDRGIESLKIIPTP
jgi:hypothetical protein